MLGEHMKRHKDEQSEKESNLDKKSETKQSLWQAIKFTLFSISAGLVQIASYYILSKFVFKDAVDNQYSWQYYGWSYFVSLALSVIWNFTFNRKFTFKSANNVPIAMLKVLAYYAVFTPLSIWWGIELVKVGWNDTIVLLLTMLINFITEFLWSKFVVFKEKKLDEHQKYLQEKAKLSYKKYKNNEYFEKARAIVAKYGKVLLIKDLSNGNITVPGGGVDDGETIKQAVIREAKEETGMDVEPVCVVSEATYEVPMKYKNKEFISKRRETYYLCDIVAENQEQHGIEGEYAGKTEIYFAEIDELSKTKISKDGIEKVKEIISKKEDKK